LNFAPDYRLADEKLFMLLGNGEAIISLQVGAHSIAHSLDVAVGAHASIQRMILSDIRMNSAHRFENGGIR
jgi:hypothetical protein